MNETLTRFNKFLEDNHPGYEECMVCKGINEKGKTNYFLVEKHKGNGCDIYIINAHMWSDWYFWWEGCVCPWEIIFKSK
jgi:hypothetical protein